MERPIFIVGAGHSGTTLMASMFAARDDTFVPEEETRMFIDRPRAAKNWEAVQEAFELSGRRYFVEKTPAHVGRFRLIRRVTPRPFFLMMFRDGRDVAASYVRRTRRWEDGRDEWLFAAQVFGRQIYHDDVYAVRYEDLILSPVHTLRGICDYFGIGFQMRMLDFHKTDREWRGVGADPQKLGKLRQAHLARRQEQMKTPLYDGRGLWQEQLPPEAAAEFTQGELGRYMRMLRYIP